MISLCTDRASEIANWLCGICKILRWCPPFKFDRNLIGLESKNLKAELMYR